MMRNFPPALYAVCLFPILAELAVGQQVAIQQPVVQNFGVGTTVSVPDRGSALLGGVSSAANGRSSSGPIRSGSSFGQSRQASSASVHVFIHDFEAMDAALLEEAGTRPTSRLDPRITGRLARRDSPTETPPPSSLDSHRLSHDAERLAEQAEARGKLGVAKLHWQRAARHGSVRAAERLKSEAPVTARR